MPGDGTSSVSLTESLWWEHVETGAACNCSLQTGIGRCRWQPERQQQLPSVLVPSIVFKALTYGSETVRGPPVPAGLVAQGREGCDALVKLARGCGPGSPGRNRLGKRGRRQPGYGIYCIGAAGAVSDVSLGAGASVLWLQLVLPKSLSVPQYRWHWWRCITRAHGIGPLALQVSAPSSSADGLSSL